MRSATRVIQSSRFYSRVGAGLGCLTFIIALLVVLVGLSAWTGSEVHNLDLDVDSPMIVLPAPVLIPAPEVTIEVSNSPAQAVTCLKYVYAVPFVCGKSSGFAAGNHSVVAASEHAFTMSVQNPHAENVTFSKAVSMTFPPGGQIPGIVFQVPGNDTLATYQALEMTCNEIRSVAVVPVRDTGDLIKGVVVVESSIELIVWGLQTSGRDPVIEISEGLPPTFTLIGTDAIAIDKERVVPVCVESENTPVVVY